MLPARAGSSRGVRCARLGIRRQAVDRLDDAGRATVAPVDRGDANRRLASRQSNAHREGAAAERLLGSDVPADADDDPPGSERRRARDEPERDLARRGRDDRRRGERPERRSCSHHGDSRPSRPGCVLRRRGGARAAGAAAEAARRRRRPARARRRLDRELRRAAVRDPLGDELRRGAAAVPGRRLRPPAPLALPRVLAGRLGVGARGRAARRAHRARRGLPRPHRARVRLLARPGGRRGRADLGARGDQPVLLARGRADEGRRQGRLGPPQAGWNHGRPRRHGGARSWRPSRSGRCRGSGRAPSSASPLQA